MSFDQLMEHAIIRFMGLGNRFFKIAKSYLNSAADSLGDEMDEWADKWDKGEFTEEMVNRLKAIKQRTQNSAGRPEQYSDEEIERILSENLNEETFKSSTSNQNRRSSTKNNSQHKLDNAYKRLGVKPTDPFQAIEKAYKKQLMKFHPDRFPDDKSKIQSATKLSQMISEAFETIKTARGK